jgi:hypothetical protein
MAMVAVVGTAMIDDAERRDYLHTRLNRERKNFTDQSKEGATA